MKAYELIDSPEKWSQRVSYRDANGKYCDRLDAVSFCAIGAIYSAYISEPIGVLNAVEDKIREHLRSHGWSFISKWNDDPERTWKEVFDTFKELDI